MYAPYLVLKKKQNKKVALSTKRATTLAIAATIEKNQLETLYQCNNISAAATQVV
jgi:hypothetical protein